MLRRWLRVGGVLAAVAAVLLLLPQTSSAQWMGRGGIGFNIGRAGFYSGSPYYSGFYPGYRSGYYGWNSPYYGSSWYPRSYGSFGLYSPGYTRWNSPGYMSGYAPSYTRWYGPRSSYDWSTPGYYSSSFPTARSGTFYSSDMSRGGYYGTQTGDTAPAADRTVSIDVRVPPDAEIWFEGNKTQSTGMFREFVSPQLEPGQDYVYQMRARWTDNGQEVNKTRELRVRAGDQLSLDLLGEAATGSATSSEQPARGTTPDTAPDTGTTPRTPPADTGTGTPGETRPNPTDNR
jgi:uncharacterized protein (TIGR03000 family)